MHLIHPRTRPQVHLRGPAVETGDAVHPQPVMHMGVVAVAQERHGVAPGQRGVQVRDDRDLVIPADHRQDRAAPRSANAALTSAARSAGVAPTLRVAGNSTGTRPVTPASASAIACSCTAGKAPAAANDGDSTATRSPPAGLGRADQFMRHAGYRTTRIAPAPKRFPRLVLQTALACSAT